MGANFGVDMIQGSTLKEAYQEAVNEAQSACGEQGYSGTIAESDGIEICHEGIEEFVGKIEDLETWAHEFGCDLAEKWGPALAVKIGDGAWLAFGWYSS